MTPARRALAMLQPWAGLIGALLGWALTHQIGSDLGFDHCERMSPLLVLLLGAFGLAISGMGGFWSWARWRREGPVPLGFVSLMGALAALLFSVAITWHTLGALVIPRCAA